jgi:hypothetical protein
MRYRIGREDTLEEVSSAWLEFARENDAGHLTREALIGRSIWDFITGAEAKHLYELVFRRVRDHGISVVIPFRCDSPSVRRYMELDVRPAGQGGIELTGRLIRSEEREPVHLLDPTVARTDDFVTVCSWCKQVRQLDERWVEVEEAIVAMGVFSAPQLPQLTHGICPACDARARMEIDPPPQR